MLFNQVEPTILENLKKLHIYVKVEDTLKNHLLDAEYRTNLYL